LWPNGWMDQDGTWHGGGPWSRPHCARLGPRSFSQKEGGAPSPIFGPFLLWPLGMEVGFSSGDIVLDGDPAPFPKRGLTPQFPAHVYCSQTAGWIKMALGVEVGLGPGHIVLDWDPAPPPQKGGRDPQFSAHFYCGQTAGCIKMPLGMEVGLCPGDFVLDGDLAPSPKRGGAPLYLAQVYCGQTAA